MSSRSTALVVIAFGCAVGCSAPKRFSPPPAAPPAPAAQRTAYPKVPARVVVPNVVVTELDLPYPPEDEVVAREYFAVAIPNQVQASLVAYGVFSEVVRLPEVGTTDADFVLKGQYRRTEFDKGKTIEAGEILVRAELELSLVDVRSGKEVFRKTYQEERKQPVVSDPTAPRSSPEYMTTIATDLSGQAERLMAFARPVPVEPVADEAVAEDEPVARGAAGPARPRRVEPVVVIEDSAKPVAARTAPARVAPARTEPAEPARTAPARTEPVEAAPARSAPARTASPQPASTRTAPDVAPPASADEDVEDWALRMRRGLTEPEP